MTNTFGAMSSVPPVRPRRRRATWFSQSSFWNFWMKQVVIYRVVPIVVLTFLTFNTWGHSFWSWSVKEFGTGKIGTIASNPAPEVIGYILVGLLVIAVWTYVLRKAWHGVGARWYKAALPAAIAGVALWLLMSLGIVPSDGNGLITAIELAFGVAVGMCFSFIVMDRRISGMGTVSTVPQGEEEHDDSHHHG